MYSKKNEKKRLWKRKLLSAKNHNQFQLNYKRKKSAHTQKKKSTEKKMKKKLNKRKGKKENKIEPQYSISFKTLYCNLTAI